MDWVLGYSLNKGRYQAGVATKSFGNKSLEVVAITGGYTSLYRDDNTLEIRTPNGLSLTNSTIPTEVHLHCNVFVNESTLILIGGFQEDSSYSAKTYYLNGIEWSDGPSLSIGRNGHSCARIRQNGSSQSFSIIVVGGYNFYAGGHMNSVEILDEGASSWRPGPGTFLNKKMIFKKTIKASSKNNVLSTS
jgi:hypothetical protein